MNITEDQRAALRVARLLIEWGAPIFRAEPDLDEDGTWRPRGGHQGTGYWLPKRWQQTECDQGVVDAWRPGDALCLVTGVLVDVIDVDPQNGGSDSLLWLVTGGLMPRSWGRATTPSGGTHDLIASIGERSWNGVLGKYGLDLKAGRPDGGGRGFVFLAPTVKLSKVTGEVAGYAWVVEPDLDELVLIGADSSGDGLVEVLRKGRAADGTGVDAYTGPDYVNLPAGLQHLARVEVERQIQEWSARWGSVGWWADGERDESGRGWEALTRDWAWTVACLTSARWSPLDEEEGELLFDTILPTPVASARGCGGKWTEDLLGKAAGRLPAPWPDEFLDGADKGGPDGGGQGGGGSGGGGSSGGGPPPPPVDVTNPADTLRWLADSLGVGRLSGIFRREGEVVFTPSVGEEGYVPPADDGDDLGPAQVRPLRANELAARIDMTHRVYKRARINSRRVITAMFPTEVATRALSVPDLMPHLRSLRGVTHTPTVRPDGSLLAEPGFDRATGVLYLPEPGLVIPPVPDRPLRDQLRAAVEMINAMLVDFPFITPDDRANYIGGALFTPMVRSMFPPPYKIMYIGAPQPGSGKSLLASISRILHGGVFKSEFPSPEEEVRKYITATLAHTTAPVVQFDNVSGVLRSSSLEGLLTSAEWSDRRLGETAMVTIPNDRLWMLTANNLRVAGDLERRMIEARINVGAPHPELRTGFAIPHLEAWVIEHRGELLGALLTIVRAWIVAGRPTGPQVESSGFGKWLTGVRGILDHAGFEGSFGEKVGELTDADRGVLELGALLGAIHRVFGEERWTVGEVLAKVDRFEDGEIPLVGTIGMGELPEIVAEKFERSGSESAARRALGQWLDFREGRWTDKFSAKKTGRNSENTNIWKLEVLA